MIDETHKAMVVIEAFRDRIGKAEYPDSPLTREQHIQELERIRKEVSDAISEKQYENEILSRYMAALEVLLAARDWISSETLPPEGEEVIVWGCIPKFNVCPQAWHARLRRSQYSPDIQWLTPCDYTVREVTHWFPFRNMFATKKMQEALKV